MNKEIFLPSERMTPEALAQAFGEFMRASETLTAAYRQLESRVERLTERLTVLLRALPVGVVVVDREEHVVEINDTALTWFGEVLGIGADWRTFRASLTPTGTPKEWIWRREEEERRLLLSSALLPGEESQIVVIQEVTETARIRETLARQERLAAMGEMVAGLAHQLRTPLASALLFLDHAAMEGVDEKRRQESLARVKSRLKRMEQLIGDMLIFARGGATKRAPVSLPTLWHQLRATYEPIAAAQGATLTVLREPPEDGPVVIGEERALLGAIGNLIDNALAVQREREKRWVGIGATVEGSEWVITVADRGPGFDETVASRLFSPFFTTRPDGTGLGLAIAHEVVRAHGGSISATSEAGKGATFVVRLPAVALPPAEQGEYCGGTVASAGG
ncbi:MAG: PAS domain-containing sensor histidine kinase [Hydrogenophilus sp.]|nr:PAS domain-containing sensor histidine kinase [Hydrogenophilus sp.]